jgi:hypothetical protein
VAACVIALVALCGCDRDAVVRVSEALDRHHPSGHVKFIHVRVLTDGRSCIVDAQQMRCDGVAAYLKDDRHTDLSESVLVGPDGTGKAAIARADEVRWSLKAAGYSDVWTIGFLTSPDHPNPDP